MTNRIKAGIIALLMGFMLVGGSFVTAQSAVATPDNTPKKVYVCKYVGTPGSDERLQTGQNPIEVSVNAIQNNQWDGTVPGWFSDAHDRSYVLGYVPMSPEPTANSCPAPDHDNNNWTYNVTCDGVTGTKPSGGSVDSNIKIKNLITGVTQTFNYHGPDNGPAGPFHYTLANYGVPASWTYFQIQWVQVNGTNYHWEGTLTCGDEPTEEPTPTETVTPTPTDEPTPTETVTATPTETVTVTLPPVTVTETVTPPAETVTVTATPTATVTETVTAPPITETATVTETPTVTETETVTAPPVTETVKVTETPTATATATVTSEATATATATVTEHTTATATATETVTITDKETKHVTEYVHEDETVYSFDELPNTGAGKAVLAVFVIGVIAILAGLWLLIRRK